MIFPNLVFKDSYKETRRVKEANNFSLVKRAKIVSEYLFNGKSHRLLENVMLGIDGSGFSAMNILHYYGLTATHKGVFRNTSLKDGISELRMFEDREHSTIADLLEIANDLLFKSELHELLDFESNKKVHLNIGNYNEISEVSQGLENIVPSSKSVTKSPTKTISDDELEANLVVQKYYGNIGEKLVLKHYTNKIIDELGDTEKAKFFISEMKHTGKKHGKGYDIVAWDINSLNTDNPLRVYIEVKSSLSERPDTPFYISRNELRVGMNLGSQFRIGRVFNLKNKKPKYFELIPFKDNLIGKNFNEELDKVFISQPTNYQISGLKGSNGEFKLY